MKTAATASPVCEPPLSVKWDASYWWLTDDFGGAGLNYRPPNYKKNEGGKAEDSYVVAAELQRHD